MSQLIIIYDQSHGSNNLYKKNGSEFKIHSTVFDRLINMAPDYNMYYILGEPINTNYTVQHRGKTFTIEGEETTQLYLPKMINGITNNIIYYLIHGEKSLTENDTIVYERISEKLKTNPLLAINALIDEFNKDVPDINTLLSLYIELLANYDSASYTTWINTVLTGFMKYPDTVKKQYDEKMRDYAYNQTLLIRDNNISNYMKNIMTDPNCCYCIIIGGNHSTNFTKTFPDAHVLNIVEEPLVDSMYTKYLKYKTKYLVLKHTSRQ